MTFEFIAGNLALDFANTVHSHGLPDPRDDLKTCADLAVWIRQAGLVSEPESQQFLRRLRVQPGRAAADFKCALKLRELVYDMFSSGACNGKPASGTLTGFNSYLKDAMGRLALQKVGKGFKLAMEKDRNLVDRALAEITRSAMGLLTSTHLARVRQCAGESCSWLFLDTSRNGMRRWCDMQACGNRAKVRRFRRRDATRAT
jgi:predicted RNA-binding Zn ribbon-like protein